MQINVRYGDETKPLNMNCKSGVIIAHLRRCAGIENDVVLDLCDKEGNVKLLRQDPTVYANTLLSANETYFLVSAADNKEENVCNYTNLANMKEEEPPLEIKPTEIIKPPPRRMPPPRQHPEEEAAAEQQQQQQQQQQQRQNKGAKKETPAKK